MEFVDADFAVGARTRDAVEIVFIDAVVDDVPLVFAGDLEYGVVCRSVDELLGRLLKDGGVGAVHHLDGTERTLCRTVGNVVVCRTGVVDRPKEIVGAFAVEHVGGFAVCPCLQRAAFGREHGDGFGFDGGHVVVQFSTCHVAVTPVEIMTTGLGIGEYVDVDLLSVSYGRFADDGFAVVDKRAGGVVGNGYADFLAATCVGTIIEIVFVGAVFLLHFFDGRCPCVAFCPWNLVGTHVEDGAFVFPIDEVAGGEGVEFITAPAFEAVGGGVDVVKACLVGVEHFGVGMKSGNDGVGVVAEVEQQAVFLGLRNGDDGAVTRSEFAFGLRILHDFECLEVGTAAELVVSAAVAVVHDNPRLSVDGAAHAYAFDGFPCLVYIAGEFRPLASGTLSVIRCQLLGCGLIDATSAFAFIEEVIELVFGIEDDVAVDGGCSVVKQELRFADEVGEIVVGIRIVDAVETVVVAGAQRIEHHVALGLVVVDGFGSPYADDVAPLLGIFRGEVDGGVRPVDEVGRFQQHHTAVAAPSERGFHVGHDHVEGLSVFTTQDVGVAHATGERNAVAVDDGIAVVERCVVVAVVADGIADLFFFRVIPRKIGEEIRHVRFIRLYGLCLHGECECSREQGGQEFFHKGVI